LPHGATLTVYNDVERIRSFDDSDNKVHGQLWTPILRGDEAVIELSAPAGTSPALLLTTVNVGFRDLMTPRSGDCNVVTAHHCQITEEVAPSLVAYWNYETSACGGSPDGKLNQFTTGATWRAGGAASDFEPILRAKILHRMRVCFRFFHTTSARNRTKLLGPGINRHLLSPTTTAISRSLSTQVCNRS